MSDSGNSSQYSSRFYNKDLGGYVYKHPHPALTADCVIFGFDGSNLKILLVERALDPYKGMWALPGGFMKIDSLHGEPIDLCIEDTARRELREETNLKNVFLQQFKVFSKAGRDPRERVVTVAFIALVGPSKYAGTVKETKAGDDAANAMWWNFNALPPMAFDHPEIVEEAKKYLAEMIRVRPLAFQLLDDTFSMPELQKVYEAITGISFDRRNFQRKAIQSGWIEESEATINEDNIAPSFACEAAAPTSVCGNISRSLSGERSSRKRKRFSFRSKDDNEEDEGSIKDLFNFWK
ncbi:MAG: NUDIX hydrolase [Muribaculaceae bacterium]|nr:NUDIX hydrolase [Muribaculaceae bacterium]